MTNLPDEDVDTLPAAVNVGTDLPDGDVDTPPAPAGIEMGTYLPVRSET